jgi:Xaa-Pro aminopeptidase
MGVDFEGIPRHLFQRIASAAPQVRFVSCDVFLKSQRMIKTPAELQILVELAQRTDHAINGCVHHITVDRRMSELTFAEELRVHSIERDLDLVGYNACARVAAGDELGRYWPACPKFGYADTRDLVRGETVRIELQNSRNGYWSDAARMMIMTQDLSEAQQRGYGYLAMMREIMLELLQPAARCDQIYAKARKAAEKQRIPLVTELGLGHGVGASPIEPPYLSSCDSTEIAENMVLVLDPVVKTDEGILRSKDTVVIGPGGPVVVNWYKDWREPYTPIMSI